MIPTIPGYHGDDPTDARLAVFPMLNPSLVKAADASSFRVWRRQRLPSLAIAGPRRFPAFLRAPCATPAVAADDGGRGGAP